MTGANAKIKRILVRPNGVEKQVYPAFITETYTVPSGYYANGSAFVYIDIAKSGYKISQVVIEGQSTSNESYSGAYIGISQNNNRDYETKLSIDFGSSNALGGRIRYRTNGNNYDDYSVPTSVISRTSNTYKVKFTRTGWELTLNGNSYSGTYSSSMLSVVTTIMDSATCKVSFNGIRITATNQIYTVTYKQI